MNGDKYIYPKILAAKNVQRGTKTYKRSIHDAVSTAGKKCKTTTFLVHDGLR